MSGQHPVLCWRLPDGQVLGVLVGTEIALIRDDERGVTSGLAAELAHHPLAPVREARLIRRVVHVRPTWREEGHRFVSSEAFPLGVDAVVATTASGWLVHMPRLGANLGFSREDLLETLLQEEIAFWSRQATPQQIHAELRVPPAWLATVPARRAQVQARDLARRQIPEILLRVTDREPDGRKRRLEPGAMCREQQVGAALSNLLDTRGHSVVVVGEPGVGKSTVLREAIRKAADAQGSRTFWRTTTHRIVAGARYLGEWQEKADQLAEALQTVDGVLWIEDMLELFTWGGSPGESIAAYWRALLRDGRLRLLGELTPRAWEVARTALPDVAATFQVVQLGELGVDATREILDQVAVLAKGSLGIELQPDARRRALRLLERFERYQHFPGKAMRFVHALLGEAEQAGRHAVADGDVIDTFERRTGLPRKLVDDQVPLRGAEIEEALGARIVEQPAARRAVAQVLLAWKAGLNDPDRPVSTLLFAGPTGVGKTATAQALAQFCYGAAARQTPLVRVDMSELSSPWQVERLLGSRTEASPVLRQLRERPFSVLLLDEVEKAHPLFFDLLLGVLDEGRLVDARGRETDFRGAVIVMTTNLGTRKGGSLGFSGGFSPGSSAEGSSGDTGAIRAFFRPEFYNRIDQVVHFTPLSREAVRAIARRELAALEEREGFRGRAITLAFEEEVVDLVVSAGFDPLFGARPLQRAIEQHVVAALARKLVDEELVAAHLVVDVRDGALVVR
jgi:ATP-dependent Clp protease ATP-binding subunit ClpC